MRGRSRLKTLLVRLRRSGAPALTLTLFQRLKEYPDSSTIGTNNWFVDRVRLGGRGRFDVQLKIGSDNDLAGFWFIADRGAALTIGSRTELNDRITIDVLERVDIGDDAMIASDVHITDNDAHSLDWNIRKYDHFARRRGERDWGPVARSPVRIGDKTWIGRRVTILKGVTIGEGAIVSEGSVVTRSVDPWTVVAGVPAKEVRKLAIPDPGASCK